MKTIIFKNEKKAKVYRIESSKNQGVYKEGELIRVVKTDSIDKIMSDGQYEVTITEVK